MERRNSFKFPQESNTTLGMCSEAASVEWVVFTRRATGTTARSARPAAGAPARHGHRRCRRRAGTRAPAGARRRCRAGRPGPRFRRCQRPCQGTPRNAEAPPAGVPRAGGDRRGFDAARAGPGRRGQGRHQGGDRAAAAGQQQARRGPEPGEQLHRVRQGAYRARRDEPGAEGHRGPAGAAGGRRRAEAHRQDRLRHAAQADHRHRGVEEVQQPAAQGAAADGRRGQARARGAAGEERAAAQLRGRRPEPGRQADRADGPGRGRQHLGSGGDGVDAGDGRSWRRPRT